MATAPPSKVPLLRQRTFIDLFAGCGGLSLGLMQSGWQGLFAIERERNAFETLEHNLLGTARKMAYDWPSWLPVTPHEIGAFIRTYQSSISKLRGTVTLLAGGPPCQGFSFAGRRNESDPRNAMFRSYIDVVKLVRPPLIVIENVSGISIEFGKGKARSKSASHGALCRPSRPMAEVISGVLGRLGYEMHLGLVRAVDFGVPQFRPRCIIIGLNSKLVSADPPSQPFQDFSEVRTELLNGKGLPNDRPITVQEAISDLETHGGKLIECVDSPGFRQVDYKGPRTTYQRLLHGDLNGTAPNSLRLPNHRDETVERFGLISRTCRRGVVLSASDRKRLGINKHVVVPLEKSRPSHTLTTLPDDLLHYREPRILTVRECARLQSFPDWFEFKGKYTTGGKLRKVECPRYTQVGNAVPPFLAEALGLVLRRLCRRALP